MSARFKSRYVELAATVILDFPRQLSFISAVADLFDRPRIKGLCHTHLYFYGVSYTGNTLSAPVICFSSLALSLMQSDAKLSAYPSLAKHTLPYCISVWQTGYNGERADSWSRRRVAERIRGFWKTVIIMFEVLGAMSIREHQRAKAERAQQRPLAPGRMSSYNPCKYMDQSLQP